MTELSLDDVRLRVQDRFDRQQFMATIGARIVAIDRGAVEIELPVAAFVTQQHGFVHGGAVASLADTACGFSALSALPAGTGVLTAEFKINFVAPAGGETLLAKGRVLKPGRTLTLSMAEVFAVTDGKQKLCAVMTATIMTIAGREGVSD